MFLACCMHSVYNRKDCDVNNIIVNDEKVTSIILIVTSIVLDSLDMNFLLCRLFPVLFNRMWR